MHSWSQSCQANVSLPKVRSGYFSTVRPRRSGVPPISYAFAGSPTTGPPSSLTGISTTRTFASSSVRSAPSIGFPGHPRGTAGPWRTSSNGSMRRSRRGRPKSCSKVATTRNFALSTTRTSSGQSRRGTQLPCIASRHPRSTILLDIRACRLRKHFDGSRQPVSTAFQAVAPRS